MNIPNEKFCVLPWISLETSPIGTARPCCLADGEVTKPSGDKYTVSEDFIEDIHNSDYMTKLRREFLDNKQPSICRRCWDVEDAGGTSKRLHTLDRLEHILEDVEFTDSKAKPLMFLDLKLGNICNIACRICGSWSSSTYATEEMKHLSPNEKRETYAYKMIRQGAWPRKTEEFWAELKELSKDIKYLEFTGGEPFMIREHFEYLKFLIDQDLAKDIEIHYNTNGTIYPTENVVLWKEFKHVEIAFSIDDIGSRFNYQRSGADWNTVLDNLGEFIYLKNNSDGQISLQVCTTVNIFNVYYLEEVAQWIKTIEHEIEFVYWNILHDAPEHCITSLPDVAKDIISKRLMSANVDTKTMQEFKNIAEFMMGQSKVTLDEVRDNINKLDKRKDESLRNIQPTLYHLIFEDYTNE
jgi:MoaA/NifB/PqqE/SkfB family radical SAM enzyme